MKKIVLLFVLSLVAYEGPNRLAIKLKDDGSPIKCKTAK